MSLFKNVHYLDYCSEHQLKGYHIQILNKHTYMHRHVNTHVYLKLSVKEELEGLLHRQFLSFVEPLLHSH